MFQISQTPFGLVSLNSSGSTTNVQTNILQGHALELESAGTLVSIFGDKLSRINPTDMSVSTLFDLDGIASDLIGNRLAVHPITGEIFFGTGGVSGDPNSYLYSVQSDGSDLKLIATLESAGLGGMDVGPSGDGSGRLSVYISTPHANTEIWELQAVPEPSSVVMFGLGGAMLLIFTARRRTQRVWHR